MRTTRTFTTIRPWRQWLAGAWLGLVLLAALLAPPELPPPDLTSINQPPFGPSHWLGTDSQGLDVGLALLLGARTLVLVSVPATLIALLLGAAMGSAAGFLGNSGGRLPRRTGVAGGLALLGLAALAPHWALATATLLPAAAAWWLLGRTRWGRQSWGLPIDAAVLGLATLLESVPLLVLVLVAVAVQRPSLGGLVALLGLSCWTGPARLVRAATLQIVAQPYLEAARAAGIPGWQLLQRHIWPNTRHVLLVRLPLTVALLVGLETTLSFLGVGLPPDVGSWGRLLAAVRLAPTDWWLVAWPGTALVGTILSLQNIINRRIH